MWFRRRTNSVSLGTTPFDKTNKIVDFVLTLLSSNHTSWANSDERKLTASLAQYHRTYLRWLIQITKLSQHSREHYRECSLQQTYIRPTSMISHTYNYFRGLPASYRWEIRYIPTSISIARLGVWATIFNFVVTDSARERKKRRHRFYDSTRFILNLANVFRITYTIVSAMLRTKYDRNFKARLYKLNRRFLPVSRKHRRSVKRTE